MTRRLFIFAAFDPRNEVGESLLYMLEALSKEGDVVLYADSDWSEYQLDKLKSLVLWAGASRHGEYDFGSYKRCIQKINANFDICAYDFVYFVNDSVFGPLSPLGFYLQKMESLAAGAFSLVINPHRKSPHMQSWFIGMTTTLFRESWLQEFFLSVGKVSGKNEVCVRYETGLTKLLQQHGVAYSGLYEIPGKQIYNSPRRIFRRGLPFVKKSSFTRHSGCLGWQLSRVLKHSPKECAAAICSDLDRIYGEGFASKLLDCSRTTAIKRYFLYLTQKICH